MAEFWAYARGLGPRGRKTLGVRVPPPALLSSNHPALIGLEDVRWDHVEHAYGPAVDVPELLQQLTGSREQQVRALYELHGNIWHQGTVYEATAHAVPFLARLALSEPLPLRDELLRLLADIANGSSYLDVHQEMVRDGLSDAQRVQLEAELAHVDAARKAVLDSVPQLVEKVMAEPTPGGLVLVARLAAVFPDHKEPFTRVLQWMWQNAEDVRLRAALAIALTRRGEDHAYSDAILDDIFEDVHAPPESAG